MIIALALVMAGLLAASVASAAGLRRFASVATTILAAIGLVAALAFLVAGKAPETLALPIGPAGGAMRLALDPLSGVFLLILFTVATASAAFALDPRPEEAPAAPLLPVFVAAMELALLAGDAFSLLAGYEAMSLAAWAMLLARPASRAAAAPRLGIACFGAACLIPAMALLSSGGDFGLAAMREAPPDGVRATVVLVLALLGAGSGAGLAPLHAWRPGVLSGAPAHVSALMSGAMVNVALYVLVRVLFDLCGPGQPLWWGVPLLLAGAASAVLGALLANMEADMTSVLAASTTAHVGFVAIGLGVAWIARASDLQPLAALALGAVLLHALNHGVFTSLLFLVAGSVERGAGTLALSRLGGLVRLMPVTTACALAGAACLAALPPSAAFASQWMLFQSVLAAPRIGGLALQTMLAIVAAAMALAVGLGAAGAVRLVGVAFLGRPRTPRGSAAVELARAPRLAMIGLAAASVALGLLPGVALGLIGPAPRMLLGSGLAGRAGWGGIAPAADTQGYAPLGIAALLACVAGAVWLVRRAGDGGVRDVPVWNGGFAAPPPWLPFGDPATQYGAASFAQPLRRILGPLLSATETVAPAAPNDPRPATHSAAWRDPAEAWLFAPAAALCASGSRVADRMRSLTVRRARWVMFGCIVACLLAIAWAS